MKNKEATLHNQTVLYTNPQIQIKMFQNLVLYAFHEGEKAYSIAFSSKTTSSDRIISGIKKHKKYAELSQYKELIFVAVNV